ncbi:MAG: ParB/RepB/Spo0J family partition protein [Marinilabiliaceae bacterium]|nr:ParB/RepB/Spo0J family partition protein [Marinilabiliaceae bacterium]
MGKKNVLGRGLNALMDNSEGVVLRKPAATTLEIDIDKIDVNPWQPRSRFDVDKLTDLAASIKEHGIIQPLTLRKTETEQYQIISGERRLKAAQIAGLFRVPAYVRQAEDEVMLELALVENIQREDLDPIEIAVSYQRLIDECNLTQEKMSERIGKKRATVAQFLRLLKLPPEIQLGLRDKLIFMGHAKILMSIDETNIQLDIYEKIIKNDLSVRDVEAIVRKLGKQQKKIEEKLTEIIENRDYEKLKSQLSGFFQTNINFSRTIKGKGKIVIPFQSDEELEKIVAILDKANTEKLKL